MKLRENEQMVDNLLYNKNGLKNPLAFSDSSNTKKVNKKQ